MHNNNEWTSQDPNIPPLPSGGADLPIPDAVPLPSTNNSGNRKKKTTIIIAAIAAVALVAVCGGVGFHLYTQNSHSYAISRYQKASHRLDNARNDLDTSISKAKSSAGKIDESQIEDASLIDDYTSTLNKTKKLSNAKPSVSVKDSEAASTSELKDATQSMDDLAGDCENSAADLTKAAQKVVDSKNAADKTLQPTEDAVAAAEDQKKSNDREAENNGVNIDDIKRGDYSSLDGTWTNPDGKWVKIQNGILTPEGAYEGTTPPYHLHTCTGYRDQCMERATPATQTELVQGGAFVDYHGHAVDFQANLLVVERNAEFDNTAPSNQDESDPDYTDQSKDRIIPYVPMYYQGQYPPCSLPVDGPTGDVGQSHPFPTSPNPSCAYYRNGGALSDASQQRLTDKVTKANKSIATLDKKWQQKAKANFQCRVDVVTGAQSSCPAMSDNS